MIITSLIGGLGNQMFQYALGRRLSWERNVPLYFDLSALQTEQSSRKYKLDQFQIHGRPATEQELKYFYKYGKARFFRKLFSLIQNRFAYYRRRVVIEQSPIFDANILNVPSHVSLRGYWQTEKYFAPIRAVLQREFQLSTLLDSVNQNLLASIKANNSISVHIRRGDYVSNPEANKMHGVLPVSYYEKAFKLMEEKVERPYFYIFSDDIPWAKKNFHDTENVTFMDHNNPANDYLDFSLMKECKFHVIANSSFSWWAAWLSDYRNKIVIAPKNWFQADLDTRDLLPEEWNKI